MILWRVQATEDVLRDCGGICALICSGLLGKGGGFKKTPPFQQLPPSAPACGGLKLLLHPKVERKELPQVLHPKRHQTLQCCTRIMQPALMNHSWADVY